METQKEHKNLDLSGLPNQASPTVEAFAQEILARDFDNINSIVITGSVVSPDYMPGRSDINSVVVLKEMKLPVLDSLASLGKRYAKKSVRAPLIMTASYIERSLDVFPIEFFDIKLLHKTIYGQDLFVELVPDRAMLRIQCERDLKAKLIHLRQGYISSFGRKAGLVSMLLQALPGFFPLLRAMLYIMHDEATPPLSRAKVLVETQKVFDISMHGLLEIQGFRSQKKPSISDDLAHRLFTEMYRITDELSLKIDEINI